MNGRLYYLFFGILLMVSSGCGGHGPRLDSAAGDQSTAVFIFASVGDKHNPYAYLGEDTRGRRYLIEKESVGLNLMAHGVGFATIAQQGGKWHIKEVIPPTIS